jgi:tight adherence protein C
VVTEVLILVLAFLAGVLLVAAAATLWRGEAARRRLRQFSAAGGGEPPAEGPTGASPLWAAWAAWTRPLQNLAAPAAAATATAPPAGAGTRVPGASPSVSSSPAGPPSPAAADEVGLVRQRFLHAGIRHPQAVAAFFGIKALLTLALPVVTFVVCTLAGVLPRGPALALALLLPASLGYWGPNLVLAQRVRVRQRAIFEAFPDALDLMTVCVEAGLGTEAALLRVAADLAPQSPALAEELRLVNLELRAGATRERALRNLALRTGVEEVEAFVTTIVQAERFGTRVAQALRVHADTLRTLRRQRAEEAAAKIALKLLFPLIFFIFPALMVVLLGPAILQIRRVLLPAMGGGG